MITRILQPYLQRDAGYYPVLTLTGPRQSGKTTLAKAAFSNYDYVSLEETEQRVFAKEDPRGFLALCAGRTGQLLNYSALATDCGIAVDTARRWVSVLKTGFIIFLLHPHRRNFNKRMIKSLKIFFYDTGLVCRLLGIRNPDQIGNHPLRGALFENYVVAEVAKAYLHHRRDPPLHFWRDKTGHEIDMLIEDGECLYPVEIKSGRTVASDMFDNLVWWSNLAGQATGTAVLVYGESDVYTRNQIAVRPWFAV